MTNEEQREFDRVVKERNNFRRHNANMRRQLNGALTLLALHGIDLTKLDDEIQKFVGKT